MDVEYIKVGCVCCSRAGHDRGTYYMVCQVLDSKYVLLCDGKRRGLQNPKKKQIKHLVFRPLLASPVAEKLRSGAAVYDFEIAGVLKAYQNSPTGEEGYIV